MQQTTLSNVANFSNEKQIRHDSSWELSAGRQISWNIIPYFFRKLGKMSQNLSSAAVVIEALRVNALPASFKSFMMIIIANSFYPDQARRYFGLGLYERISRLWWYPERYVWKRSFLIKDQSPIKSMYNYSACKELNIYICIHTIDRVIEGIGLKIINWFDIRVSIWVSMTCLFRLVVFFNTCNKHETAWPLDSLVYDVFLIVSLSHMVSWVSCDTWLYRFMSIALFITHIRTVLSLSIINLKFFLSYDVASESEITPCNKICKPLVVYRFSGNVMTSITTLRT